MCRLEIARKRGNGLVKVITGLRRCGKSYLMRNLFKSRLLAEGLREDQIVEMAFDERDNLAFRSADTFYEFATPLMRKLNWPTLFCNSIQTDADGNVCSYKMRLDNGKLHAVLAFKQLNFSVVAMGDSYNDTAMLKEADMVYGERFGYHIHYLPKQEALDALSAAFAEMRRQSLDLCRDPRICQCEFREEAQV